MVTQRLQSLWFPNTNFPSKEWETSSVDTSSHAYFPFLIPAHVNTLNCAKTESVKYSICGAKMLIHALCVDTAYYLWLFIIKFIWHRLFTNLPGGSPANQRSVSAFRFIQLYWLDIIVCRNTWTPFFPYFVLIYSASLANLHYNVIVPRQSHFIMDFVCVASRRLQRQTTQSIHCVRALYSYLYT